MLTTCPECRTSFRITQLQVDSRQGMVRCGRCHAVFNAYDMLLPELEAPPRQVIEGGAPRQERLAPQLAELAPTVLPPIAAGEPQAGAEPGLASDQRRGEPAAEVGEGSQVGVVVALAEPSGNVPAYRAAVAEGTDAILFSEPSTRRRAEAAVVTRQRLARWALNVLLIVLLLTQGVFFLRVWIANQVPGLRPWLADACGLLGCELPLPRQLAALRVEASSLETDPEQRTRARLHVTFSNRSAIAQVWPHFILKLTDMRGAALAQRVFAPADYLPEPESAASMAPMSELEFTLDLDLSQLAASGYEVSAHYP